MSIEQIAKAAKLRWLKKTKKYWELELSLDKNNEWYKAEIANCQRLINQINLS
jgi:hypothetical protein